MIVALDVGNTNIKYSLVNDGESVVSGHIATPTVDAAETIERWLPGLLDEAPPGARPGSELVLVSVVPPVTDAILEVAARHGLPVLIADRSTIPMPVRVANPEQVGDDRLVNAYAAARIHGTPAIVVDMGTATTFDVVDAQGAFVGGAIAAGAGLGLDALSRGTARLPRVPLLMPPGAIGADTVTAMQSGAVIGHSGLVLVLIRAISQELTAGGGPKPKVVLTGGHSTAEWAQAIPDVDVIDPYLILEGLVRLHAELASTAGAQA